MAFTVLNNFWNKTEFRKLSNYERGKEYFVINRRFAIAHPKISAYLSVVGINTGQAVLWLQLYMTNMYKSYPKFLFTTTKSNAKKEKLFSPKKEAIDLYCKMNKCEAKDIFKAYELFPEDIENEFKDIDKILKDMDQK